MAPGCRSKLSPGKYHGGSGWTEHSTSLSDEEKVPQPKNITCIFDVKLCLDWFFLLL